MLSGCAGDRLVVAVDARDGRVAVDGWTGTSKLEPVELARRCAAAGVTRLLVTSTRRGTARSPVPTSSCSPRSWPKGARARRGRDRLRRRPPPLRDLGCEGAVVGSALLAGRFTLSEAIEACARRRMTRRRTPHRGTNAAQSRHRHVTPQSASLTPGGPHAPLGRLGVQCASGSTCGRSRVRSSHDVQLLRRAGCSRVLVDRRRAGDAHLARARA